MFLLFLVFVEWARSPQREFGREVFRREIFLPPSHKSKEESGFEVTEGSWREFDRSTSVGGIEWLWENVQTCPFGAWFVAQASCHNSLQEPLWFIISSRRHLLCFKGLLLVSSFSPAKWDGWWNPPHLHISQKRKRVDKLLMLPRPVRPSPLLLPQLL